MTDSCEQIARDLIIFHGRIDFSSGQADELHGLMTPLRLMALRVVKPLDGGHNIPSPLYDFTGWLGERALAIREATDNAGLWP